MASLVSREVEAQVGAPAAPVAKETTAIEHFQNVWRKWNVFDGRSSRAEYWYFVLFQLLIGVLLGFVEGLTGMYDAERGSVLANLYGLVAFIPGLAVTVRRMHDVDRSGWWCLVPIVNFVFTLLDGSKGKNRFGEDPSGRTA